jgi:hypothetical protein
MLYRPDTSTELDFGKLEHYILPVLPILIAGSQEEKKSERLLQAYIELLWFIGDEVVAAASADKDILSQAQLLLSVYSIAVSSEPN